MQPDKRQSSKKLASMVVTIIVVAGIVIFADHLKSSATSAGSNLASTGQSSPSSSPASTATSSQSSGATGSSGSSMSSGMSASSSPYKDGTYSASSSYFVPHSNESIKVTVTIKNGVITGSSITNSEGDPTSAYYQQDFASSYKSFVVGQKIADLQLGVIAGASDTTQGFANALSQIQSQAQA